MYNFWLSESLHHGQTCFKHSNMMLLAINDYSVKNTSKYFSFKIYTFSYTCIFTQSSSTKGGKLSLKMAKTFLTSTRPHLLVFDHEVNFAYQIVLYSIWYIKWLKKNKYIITCIFYAINNLFLKFKYLRLIYHINLWKFVDVSYIVIECHIITYITYYLSFKLDICYISYS